MQITPYRAVFQFMLYCIAINNRYGILNTTKAENQGEENGKTSEKMVKAVLFDFDGVICQTETYRIEERAAYLRNLGLKVDMRQMYRLAGGTRHGRAQVLDELFGDQESYWLHREEILAFRHQNPPYGELKTPGIEEVLHTLKIKGFSVGVASNSSKALLEEGLTQCRVRQYIDVIVSGWDTGRRKPDPYVYLAAMEQLGLISEQCLVVEDSSVGIQAGKAAGCRVIALKDRDGFLDQKNSDAVIERIEELLDYTNSFTEGKGSGCLARLIRKY